MSSDKSEDGRQYIAFGISQLLLVIIVAVYVGYWQEHGHDNLFNFKTKYGSIRVNYNWTTDLLRFVTVLWKSRESLSDVGNALEIAGMDWIWHFQWSLNISAHFLHRIFVFDIMGWSALDSADMACIPWNFLWNVVESLGLRCGNICYVEPSIETGLKFSHIGVQGIPQHFTRNSREYKPYPRNPMHFNP